MRNNYRFSAGYNKEDLMGNSILYILAGLSNLKISKGRYMGPEVRDGEL
jgi:hypothetical protein